MQVQALLRELRENILHDRSDRVEGETDRLWSDQTLLTYMNEAQRRFARMGLVLRDAQTPEVTEVALVPGQAEYTLHPSVLGVLSVRLDDSETDLQRVGHPDLGFQHPGRYQQSLAWYRSLPPGRTKVYSTDEQVTDDGEGRLSSVCLRVYPKPTDAEDGLILRLRVVRLPLEDLCTCSGQMEPEIPSIHHIEMLDWAAYLALRIVDQDAGLPNRAHEFRAQFENNVNQARRVAMRKMFAPMGFTFGNNGFTWSGAGNE